MKSIKLYELKKEHFPLVVKPYQTGEGNDGFALFTANDQRVYVENGSYGYDTYFYSGVDATEVARFLNEHIKL